MRGCARGVTGDGVREVRGGEGRRRESVREAKRAIEKRALPRYCGARVELS